MNSVYIYKFLKIFVVLLLLQFFLYNFVTFVIWIDNQVIWLWKELFIVFAFLYSAYLIIKNKDYSIFFKNSTILKLEIWFIALIIFALIVSIFVKNLSLGQFVLAFKYDLFGFAIFFIFYHFSSYFDSNYVEKLVKFIWKVLKISLVAALLWYMLIVTKPSFMNRLWYDYNSYEWSIWSRPPAAYYSNMKTGIPRNQFVFERPITWWFFLVAFWPLFYMLYLRRKSLKKTYMWWALYWINVLITFSRAAWWAWIFEIVALWAFVYWKNWKRFLKKILIPIMIVVLGVVFFGYQQIIHRQFSNTWHIRLINEWVQMLIESPLFWVWAWYAWPASHQICIDKNSEVCERLLKINQDMDSKLIGFNPENQFLQIAVEFGIPLFLLWMYIYIFFNYIWIKIFLSSKSSESKTEYDYWMLALSLWMIWLSIEWLVLHSFVDRMIVYPFMMIFWLVYWSYFIQKSKIVESTDFWSKK